MPASLSRNPLDQSRSAKATLRPSLRPRQEGSAEPSGSRILGCSLYLENPLEVDGTSREVFCDLGAVLERAQAAGHDAVILRNIADRPSGAARSDDHVAVFDPGRIRIDEVILEEDFPCTPDEPEPL